MVGFQYQIQGLSSQLVAGGGEKEEGEILVDNELRPADADNAAVVTDRLWS